MGEDVGVRSLEPGSSKGHKGGRGRGAELSILGLHITFDIVNVVIDCRIDPSSIGRELNLSLLYIYIESQ